jgi:hypothetical protein
MKLLPSSLIPVLSAAALSLSLPPVTLRAGTPVDTGAIGEDTRYGFFNGLDHRSQYGKGVFPEPFLIDDSDLEVNEFRFDWFYAREPGDVRSNELKVEIEKGFGNLTVEVEIPYVIERAPDGNTHAFDNIDIGARYPLYQFVSKSGFFDTTFGVAVEVGIPTTSSISKNTELVPKIFNDTMIGNFTMQSIFGYSMLFGPGEDGGAQVFEYGFLFGYAIQRPFSGLEQLVPFFELSGETALNHGESGHNSLIGNTGFRFNLRPVHGVQPRLGVGYVFPIDKGGREDLRSGVFTSLVFEW